MASSNAAASNGSTRSRKECEAMEEGAQTGLSLVGAGMKMRRVAPEDAEQLARKCYDSFREFNQSVGIPHRLDFSSVESAIELMTSLASSAAVYGVVAVEEPSGAIMAGGFIIPGDMYEVGPIFADNAFKRRGAAKAVMVSLLEKAKSAAPKSIRLNQIVANTTSFALYASLGFVPVDCWMDFEGCVTSAQALSASHSGGYQPLPGVHVRRMKDVDVKACNDLHIKTNGLGREQEIRMLISNAWVAIRDGELVAYTTGFSLMGHTVAETEEVLVTLFREVCLQRRISDPLPAFHVLGRLYPRLLQWALAAKLKLRRVGYKKIYQAVRKEAEDKMEGVLLYNGMDLVSSAIIGDNRSSILNATASFALADNFVKLLY